MKTIRQNIRNAAATLATMFLCGAAMAQSSGGWTKSVNNIGDLGQAIVNTLIILCGVGGVAAFAFAGKQLMKKAGDRGDDVEWAKIGYSTLAGVFLIAIAWVALNSVQTLGADESAIGKQIQIKR